MKYIMVDSFQKKILHLKSDGIFEKAKYDELKKAIQDGRFEAYRLTNDIQSLTSSRYNVFDIAILHEDFWLVSRLVEELEEQDPLSLKKLLVKPKSKSPLLDSAALKNPHIFNLLLEKNVGFSIEELEAAKAIRKQVQGQHRFLGRMAIGSFLKSACPSKSFADTLNVSDTLAGFGFIVGVGLTGVFSLPLIAWGALVGLACISFANFRKMWIERRIENEEINTAILIAQLKNFEKRIEAYEGKTAESLTPDEKVEIQKDLNFLKAKMQVNGMKNLQRISIKNRKNLIGFITRMDNFFTAISTIGDVLCTNAGFLSIGAYFFIATASVAGLPWVVLGLTVMAMIAVTTFYVLENKTQRIEFAEKRREEFDFKISRYKNFKNFINHNGYGLTRVFDLLKSGDVNEDKVFEASFDPFSNKLIKTSSKNFDAEYQAFIALDTASKIQKIRQTVIEGKRGFFNFLIKKGVDITNLAVLPTDNKTLLHLAIENGHTVMVEEMLGVSVIAENRISKEKWLSPHKNYQEISQNYKTLSEQSKNWLLTRDGFNKLPLHYAADKRDTSLYQLLLEQPVPYSKADLDKASNLRLSWIKGEKNWLLTSALVESICPGTSLSEIIYSLSFGILVGASTVLTWGIGIAALGIYAMVALGNYHKTKVERGITTDLEQLLIDTARVKSVHLRLSTLQATITNQGKMSDDEIIKARNELAGLQTELDELKKLYPSQDALNPAAQNSGFKAKLREVIKPLARIARTYGGTLGTFLCGYAGTLGIIELVATATSLVITGPIGWILLGAGALIGCMYAGFYYRNRQNDLKTFATRTLKVTQDKEYLTHQASSLKLVNIIEHISLSLDLKETTTQQAAMQQLSQHQPHPGCDLSNSRSLIANEVAPPASPEYNGASVENAAELSPSLPSSLDLNAISQVVVLP